MPRPDRASRATASSLRPRCESAARRSHRRRSSSGAVPGRRPTKARRRSTKHAPLATCLDTKSRLPHCALSMHSAHAACSGRYPGCPPHSLHGGCSTSLPPGPMSQRCAGCRSDWVRTSQTTWEGVRKLDPGAIEGCSALPGPSCQTRRAVSNSH